MTVSCDGIFFVYEVMCTSERRILRAHEKFVFGVWVKATDDDDILAVAYNMVMVPSSN